MRPAIAALATGVVMVMVMVSGVEIGGNCKEWLNWTERCELWFGKLWGYVL